jgi:hypothetical protein
VNRCRDLDFHTPVGARPLLVGEVQGDPAVVEAVATHPAAVAVADDH